MKTALISGAGIAGLTTAYWLSKNNWHVTIVEKSKSERTEGYMMDFYGNGWDVAEKMGITDQIKHMDYPISSLKIVNDKGNPYFSIPINRMIKGLQNKYRPIRRPDLERILMKSAKKLSATILYDTTITALENTPHSIKAKLSNGQEQSYDIVVGADGVHSQVRRLVFGEEDEFNHYLGYIFAAFHTKRDRSIGNHLSLYQEPNRQFGMYPYSEDKMDVLYILRSKFRKRLHQSEYKAFLLKEFKHMGWKAEPILQNTPEENITYLDTTEQIRMKTWYKNRVVLVGDAAACPTLAAGQGASMAMTEAYMLAKSLAEHEQIHQAFEIYQKELSDYVLTIQVQAEKFAKNFVPDTKLEVFLQRWFMAIALSPWFVKRSMEYFTGRKVL